MSENIHQGWLYARDENKFAPFTLVDNIYAMDGNKYKDVIENKVATVQSNLDTAITTVNNVNATQQQKIEALQAASEGTNAKLDNFRDDESNTLYVIDNNDNVIAYINNAGVHSIDFLIGAEKVSVADFIQKDYQSFVSSTNTSLAALTKALDNFGDDESGVLYIVDGTPDKNVIAYFDAAGTHSINFITPEGDLNTAIVGLAEETRQRVKKDNELDAAVNANATEIARVDAQLDNFGDDNGNTLYITDGTPEQNVIAYVNDTGVHSINIHSKNYDLETAIPAVNSRIDDIHNVTLPALKSDLQTADSAIKTELKQEIDTRLANFGDDNSDKLFITDGTIDQNVIAMVDASGVHSINIYSTNADLETVASDLFQEVKDRKEAISKIDSAYKTADSAIIQAYGDADTALEEKLTQGFSDADKELKNSIETAYKAADSALEEKVTSAYVAADNKIISDYQTADQAIYTYYNNIQPDDDSGKLFIVDDSENKNVIAYIDETGIHGLNIYSANYNLESDIARLDTRIDTINNSHSTDVATLMSYINTQDATDRSHAESLVSSAISSLTQAYQNADSSLKSTLESGYTGADTALKSAITSEYQAADTAVQSALSTQISGVSQELTETAKAIREEFAAADTAQTSIITTAYEANDNVVRGEFAAADTQVKADLKSAFQTADAGLKADYENRLKNFSGDDGSTLYIIDGITTDDNIGASNVIAYFDNTGLHVTNVTLENNKNAQLNGIYCNSYNIVTYTFN